MFSRRRLNSPFCTMLAILSLLPPLALASEFPRGQITDTFASYEQIEEINHSLNPVLNDILHNTDFFGYYRLNLYEAQCPVSWGNAFPMCGNRACAVATLEEEEIPEVWRASVLGQVEGPIATHPISRQKAKPATTAPLGGALGHDAAEMCIFDSSGYDSERDYCIPEDESNKAGGVYVSLANNPERFTGYAGDHAQAVWREIYRENCFELQPQDEAEKAMVNRIHESQSSAKNDLEAVMLGRFDGRKSGATLEAEYDQMRLENTCLEKRVFWRIISGMHASISTHLCWDYLNQTTGQWGPNSECFQSRLGDNPQWIENLYFNYVVVLRALTKVSHYLEDYSYCSGDPDQDDFTRDKVHKLVNTAQIAAPSFDESRMFDPNDPTIRGLKDEFRERFRNVSRIMDCVGCDKCRLWGKLQTGGYGTALKVLFEFDAEKPDDFTLRRTEVVSLVITLQRLSHSIWVVEQFREMLSDPGVESMTTAERIMMYFRMAEFKPFGEALEQELGEFTKALLFVLKSYVLLPVNLWKMGMMFMSRMWDHYIIGGSAIGRARLEL